MTLRSRMFGRPQRRSLANSEDRFQSLVTIGFIGVIVAVVVLLVAAVAVSYYNAHLKPVATVGARQITRDDWLERARLILFRIDEARNQSRAELAAGRIDQATWQQRDQALDAAESQAPAASLEDLINLVFQAQLAGEEGVTVSEDDVLAAIEREASVPEQRRVQAIFVEPVTDDPGGEPTPAQDQAAREDAGAALADLEDGFPFAQAAQQWSTDISSENGGEYGYLTVDNPTDTAWVDALFELQVGETTEVIKGSDGVYRIARVTEIVPVERNSSFETYLSRTVPLDAYREDVRMEEAARKLRELITDRATATDVEQLHLAEIVILQSDNEDPATEDGTIHASHILYSPNDDPETAAEADEAAVAAARSEAEMEVERLRAIADPEERKTAFHDAAEAVTDDPREGDDGGDLGFFAREAPYVAELTNPLFDDPSLQSGDIVGPIQTDFGFHVVQFLERRPPFAQRVESVKARLAEPNADFAAIARELSDGDTAADGGDLGWLVREELPAEAADALFALEPNATSEGFDLADGFHVYRLLERATRPLDDDQRALLKDAAFDTWYQERFSEAEASGRITRDQPAGGEPQPGELPGASLAP